MDILKVIMDLAGNDLVREVGLALVGVFAGGLGVWLWVKTGASKLAKEKPQIVVNRVALAVYDNFLNHIKDGNLKEKITLDLDCSGDDFNDAWDKGIRGIKI